MSETTTAEKSTEQSSSEQKPQTAIAATSASKEGSTSQVAPIPRTFTEAERDTAISKAVRDALTKAGRDAKSLEKWQTNLEEKETQLSATQERLAELERDFEELSQDDPDRKIVLSKIKVLETKESKLNADRKALDETKNEHEQEWTSHQERIARAETTNFEIDVWMVADEYDGGDAVKLKTACERAKITDIEAARGLADILWVKKSDTAPAPLVEGKPYSGGTTGGANQTINQIRSDYVAGKISVKKYEEECKRLGISP